MKENQDNSSPSFIPLAGPDLAVMDPLKVLGETLGELAKIARGVVLSPIPVLGTALKGFAEGLSEAGRGALSLGSPLAGLVNNFKRIGSALAAAGGAAFQSTSDVALSLRNLASSTLVPLRSPSNVMAGVFDGLITRPLGSLRAGLGDVFASVFSQTTTAVRALAERTTLGFQNALPATGTKVAGVMRLATDALAAFVTPIERLTSSLRNTLTATLPVGTEIASRISQIPGRVYSALASAFTALGTPFVAAGRTFPPVNDVRSEGLNSAIRLLTEDVQAAIPIITTFTRVINALGGGRARSVQDLVAVSGIERPETRSVPTGASLGEAIRAPSIGRIDNVIEQARGRAFSLGTAPTDSTTRTGIAATDVNKLAVGSYQGVKEERLMNFLEGLSDRTWNLLAELPRTLADAIRNTLPGGETQPAGANASVRGDACGIIDAARGGFDGATEWLDDHTFGKLTDRRS